MSETRSLLIGSGTAAGPIVIENHRLARIMDTNDQWIRERSGIEQRYFVPRGVGASELGIQAANAALEDAGVAPSELDYIVCATMTPDHYFPGSGTLIQEGIGSPPVPALDIRQQCAGFAYGMQMVDALIRSGVAKTVLLVGCDVHSCLMPFSDESWDVLLGDEDRKLDGEDFEWNSRFRHLLVLFGDAAGAFVFRRHDQDDGRGIIGCELYGEGANSSILHVPGMGSKSSPIISKSQLESGDWVPYMEGRQVFKLAVTRMPEVTRSLLTSCDYELDDLELLIMHQANLRICEAAQKQLALPDEKVHNNIQRYGNTTSATLPLAFHEAREQGRVDEGDLVAFTALGAGLHWGAVLLRV